jgi:hypothetical protein
VVQQRQAMLRPIPLEWARSLAPASQNVGCQPCSSYKVLVNSWRKALKWTVGLDHALTTMLASIASVKLLGDQLWIKVVSPASTGKSALCEAVSVNSQYVCAKSSIRGFFSGYREGSQGVDAGLVPLIRDKTLVTKDGDTLLQSPNLPQILSEGRDLYDGTSRTHYRNMVVQDHSGVRTTWILCGTSSLRQLDSSELGERFLDCVIMEDIDDELEEEIGWRVANRADRSMGMESNGKPETHNEPAMAEAMQLTGGYVSWLRENAGSMVGEIRNPDWAKWLCVRLGKFVALMRARPSLRQDEKPEREFSARLVSQLVRLAKCLAFVLNKDEVDEEVIGRVRQVALDTARGRTLTIASMLYDADNGIEPGALSIKMGISDDKVRTLLRFLRAIRVVDHVATESIHGVHFGGRARWVLTKGMEQLYEQVVQAENV